MYFRPLIYSRMFWIPTKVTTRIDQFLGSTRDPSVSVLNIFEGIGGAGLSCLVSFLFQLSDLVSVFWIFNYRNSFGFNLLFYFILFIFQV